MPSPIEPADAATPTKRPIHAIRQMREDKIPDLLNELVLSLVATKPEDPLTALIDFLEARRDTPGLPHPTTPPPPLMVSRATPTVPDSAADMSVAAVAAAAAASNGNPLGGSSSARSPLPTSRSLGNSITVGGSPLLSIRGRQGRGAVVTDRAFMSQTEVLGQEARRLMAAIEAESTKQMAVMGINTSKSEPADATLAAIASNHRAMLATLESLGRNNEELTTAMLMGGMTDGGEGSEGGGSPQGSPRKGQLSEQILTTLNLLEDEEDALRQLLNPFPRDSADGAAVDEAHARMLEAIDAVRHYATALCAY